MSGRTPHGLSGKHKLFAAHYAKTHNATQAYIDAGYAVTTRKNAGANGHGLLKNPDILSEVEKNT